MKRYVLYAYAVWRLVLGSHLLSMAHRVARRVGTISYYPITVNSLNKRNH